MLHDLAARWGPVVDERLRPGRAARVACAVAGVVLVVAGARFALGAVRGE